MTTEFYLGTTLQIGDATIELNPETPINQIEEQGFKLSLPDRTELGLVSNLFDEALTSFDAYSETPADGKYSWGQLQEDVADIPFVTDFVNILGAANIALEELDIDIKPASSADKDEYTIAMSMTWDPNGPVVNIVGIKLIGVYFKIKYTED